MVASWKDFKNNLFFEREGGFSLDYSRVGFPEGFFARYKEMVQRSCEAMKDLESGGIANPTEERMVGHFWLRNPALAPEQSIADEIKASVKDVKEFAADVASGKIHGPKGKFFKDIVVIGIGGSALGTQFLTRALQRPDQQIRAHFLDNTDSDGMKEALSAVSSLEETLCIVISKSGGTRETLNGQIIASEAYRSAGLNPGDSFVAVTQEGSKLSKLAGDYGWLNSFPLWDWVGGRTSVWSPVGLLPLALQGYDIDRLLAGGRKMDEWTRRESVFENPALLLALSWYHLSGGEGRKHMAILPYRDRLELFGKYLQQLVMESLGKADDLDGKRVNQGLTVFGNKGSTDQHSYVQQLRDGLSNFFAVFVEVLSDEQSASEGARPYLKDAHLWKVAEGLTSGDYLAGFLRGTREALSSAERNSLTITVDQLDELALGMLIALFERAVGFYASFINVNAYDQPGVEAGKIAAENVVALQKELVEALRDQDDWLSVEAIAGLVGQSDAPEMVFHIIRRLSNNGVIEVQEGKSVFDDLYRFSTSRGS